MLREINIKDTNGMRTKTIDAKPEHVSGLMALDRACFSGDDLFSEEAWKDYCDAFFHKIIIPIDNEASNNDTILANMVATIFGPTVPDNTFYIYIDHLAVSEAYRKQGAATQLFGLLVDAIILHNQQYPDAQYHHLFLHVN